MYDCMYIYILYYIICFLSRGEYAMHFLLDFWVSQIPGTEVAAAATLLPGARDISKAWSLCFSKYLAVLIRSQQTQI